MVIYKSKSFKLNLHGYPPIEKLLGQEIDAVISGNSPKSHRNINKTALMDSLVTQLREYLLCGNLYTACHVCDSCIRSR